MINIFNKFKISNYSKTATKVLKLSESFNILSDDELRAKLGGDDDVELFASLVVLAERTLGLKAFYSQIIGALACYDGFVIDMKTGEGKTLVACLSAIALYHRGYVVNVATANTYLANRDFANMSPLYAAAGVYVKRLSLRAADSENNVWGDVNYISLSEDGCLCWLNDHLANTVAELTHPQLLPFTTAKSAIIVDEIDQSLIESSSVNYSITSHNQVAIFSQQIAEICKSIETKTENVVFDKNGEFNFTEEFYRSVEIVAVNSGLIDSGMSLYDDHFSLLKQFESAYIANHVLKESVDYVVKSEKIVHIDKRTGRLVMGGFDGSVLAYLSYKHNLELPKFHEVLISSSLQNYVSSFDLLCGMSGTAKLNAHELRHSYGLTTLTVPQNIPTQRVDHGHILFKSDSELLSSVVSFLCKTSREQRPTLVICDSESQAEDLAAILTQKAVNITLLTSSNIDKEDEIIAGAGAFGSMIITTRLCSRGSDVVCEDKERGLLILVLGLSRTKNEDMQIIGRTGRQGAKGDTYLCVSLEDKLLKKATSKLGNKPLLSYTQSDLTALDDTISDSSSLILGRIQQGLLIVPRERRKTTAIYSKPIRSQLKLLMSKREQFLFCLDPVASLEQLIEMSPQQKNLLDHYQFIFSDKDAFHNVVRIALGVGLTKSWSKHQSNLNNLKNDTSNNTQASTNINNFKRQCLESFFSFSERLNNEIFAFALVYIEQEAKKKIGNSIFLPNFKTGI